jgi:hypothetical protein
MLKDRQLPDGLSLTYQGFSPRDRDNLSDIMKNKTFPERTVKMGRVSKQKLVVLTARRRP